jgi:hypothetical protein
VNTGSQSCNVATNNISLLKNVSDQISDAVLPVLGLMLLVLEGGGISSSETLG